MALPESADRAPQQDRHNPERADGNESSNQRNDYRGNDQVSD
jgi:hypothetical protein